MFWIRIPERLVPASSLYSWAVLGVLVLTVSAAGCAGNAATPTTTPSVADDEAAVTRLVNYQRDLLRARDWAALYETYSPAAREQCAKEAFIGNREGKVPPTTDLTTFSVDEFQPHVEGDKAYATYVDTLVGRPIALATGQKPDVYVKIDGEWYDEFDSTSSC